MNESLKLSYDMLFKSSSVLEEADTGSRDEPQIISSEEMQHRLQENDDLWRKKMEKEQKDAEETGFEKGFAEGKNQAEQQYLKQLTRFEEMIKQMDDEYNQAMEDLKPYVAGLVFDITEKVLDIPFERPELRKRVQEEVSQIIESLDDEIHINVALSEADFKEIQTAFADHEKLGHMTLQTDEKLKQGEYKVETEKEIILNNFNKMVEDFKESVSFNNI